MHLTDPSPRILDRSKSLIQNIREILFSVKAILSGTAGFMIGNSLLGAALPLRMDPPDYPVALTGAIVAAN